MILEENAFSFGNRMKSNQSLQSAIAVPIRWMVPLALFSIVGCADGLWYQMKKANPYYRAEWKKDEEYGTTFVQRLNEMEVLKSRLPTMTPDQQTDWAQNLERVISQDSSPEYRALAVTAIGSIRSDATIRALNAASADTSEKVRMAACRAWRETGSTDARDMLMTLANNSSESTSIRQAAVEGLGDFDDEEVRNTLTLLLEDRSPAIQYQVTRSLAKLTGRDFGGDMQLWQDYMSGKAVTEPTKSLTATLLDMVPGWR